MVVVYHLWSRAGRATFREHNDEQRAARLLRSQQRVRYLLGMQAQVAEADVLTELDKVIYRSCFLFASHCLLQYGLGSSRTLAAFEAHTGVKFADRLVSDRARYGGRERSEFATERAEDALALVMAAMSKQGK